MNVIFGFQKNTSDVDIVTTEIDQNGIDATDNAAPFIEGKPEILSPNYNPDINGNTPIGLDNLVVSKKNTRQTSKFFD